MSNPLDNMRVISHEIQRDGWAHISVGSRSRPIHHTVIKEGQCYSMNYNIPAFTLEGSTVTVEGVDICITRGLVYYTVQYVIYYPEGRCEVSKSSINEVDLFLEDPRPYLTTAGKVLYGKS